ncbi:hypothetical protein [Asanoa siamensis]|uniref:Tetratricopeptide repeat protein n=1 Tax=Asanoa siamensis TaxID=926357 RepID=A0ABQ4D2B0_9ACTN|nr:hypothetical protein [Asanoa siamensis]GIF77257.1 hypothetical protein Asi02nite_67750 [Asanoa siamensis]
MTERPSRAELIAAVARRTAAADRTGSATDLDAAEAALRALLDALGPADPIRPRTLATLGSVVRRQWEQGRRPDGRTTAVALLHAALSVDSPDRALCLANLGNTLLVGGDEADLDEVVAAFTEAVELTGAEEPPRSAYLSNLGAALVARARARARSSEDDLDRGIAAIDAGLDTASADDPRLPTYRANLADALRTRFSHTYERADIDRAAELGRAAAEQNPSPTILAVLGGVLLSQAQATGDEPAEALQALGHAVRATPPKHAMRARRLAGLASALSYRAELDDDPADLERAEALLLTAARLRPERAVLVNLSAVTIRLAELTGDDARLDRAVAIARDVDATNLATALHLRAARTSSIVTLDEAAAAATTALDSAAPGTTAHAGALSNLSGILMTRYLRTGRGADLDRAVETARGGADGTVDGDPELPGRLSNLGNVLRLRGTRRRSQRDLDDAVRVLRRAAELARTDQAQHLSNLGAALQSLAELGNGDPADAVPVLQAAVAYTRPDSPARPKYLSNLGNALTSAGDPTAGVASHRDALRLLPAGHPDRAVVLGNLAHALIATGDDAALPEAIDVTREVADDPAANGQDRLLSAWRLADLQVQAAGGAADVGAPAMRTALELAERIAWLGATAADRPYTLARFSSLALDAAAALARHDPAAALGALETGRGVGWREQLGHRRFDALAEHDAALAGRLRAIGTALDRPLTT